MLVQFDVKADSPETDIDQMVKKIRSNLPSFNEKVQMQEGHTVKPLFFGIKAAVCQFIIPEEDGAQDKLEEFLLKQDGVSVIELSFITRL